MTSREQFEKWYREARRSAYDEPDLYIDARGQYSDTHAHEAWVAWQASRVALEGRTDMGITVKKVNQLRELSGEGILSCKTALVTHAGDVAAALEHLRCEGQAVVRRPGSLKPCGCVVRS